MFLFDKPLFDKDKLDNICKEFPRQLLIHSKNSAKALYLLIDFIKNKQELCPFFNVLNFTYLNLADDNFMCQEKDGIIKANLADVYFNDFIDPFLTENINCTLSVPTDFINSKRTRLLAIKFAYYYMTRLPLLIKGVGEVSAGHRRKISDKELSIISNSCIEYFDKNKNAIDLYNEFPHVFNGECLLYKFGEEYKEAQKFKHEKVKLEFINDYTWIFRGPVNEETLLPSNLNLSYNNNFMLKKILDDYFIIFYKALQAYYSKICFSIYRHEPTE